MIGTNRTGKARFHANGEDDHHVTVRSGVLVCNQCGREHTTGDELCFFFHPERGQGGWVCSGDCYDKQVESARQHRLAADAHRRLGGGRRSDENEGEALYTGIFSKVGT